MDYRPQSLDKKWQERWTSARAFEVTEGPSRPKFYCLEMFAYPSGHAHVGHVRNYQRGELEAKLERAGYRVMRAIYWGFPFYSPIARTLQNHSREGIGSFKGRTYLLAELLYRLYFLNSWRKGDILVVVAEAK